MVDGGRRAALGLPARRPLTMERHQHPIQRRASRVNPISEHHGETQPSWKTGRRFSWPARIKIARETNESSGTIAGACGNGLRKPGGRIRYRRWRANLSSITGQRDIVLSHARKLIERILQHCVGTGKRRQRKLMPNVAKYAPELGIALNGVLWIKIKLKDGNDDR